MLFSFLDQWRSIPSNRFVLNMVWGSPSFATVPSSLVPKLLVVKFQGSCSHHPNIQKEVDELLSKGTNEPSSGVAGFYSSMFVVPKHTGGLWPILKLKHFNHYLHIPSLRCLLSDMYSILLSVVIMLSPLIYRMLIYIFLSLNIIIISYNLFNTMCLISGRFCLLGWPQPLGFSQPSLTIFCSFAIARVSILSILMTSWSWFALSGQIRGLTHFYVPY